jgi:outer membrane protein TolC
MRAWQAWPLLALAGCASYEPLALPESPSLARQVAQLQVDTASMPTTELAAHRFDPSDGLDMDEVAMLAVANSPDLRAARADAGVTRAQAFAAGLLPDPQLALSREAVLGAPAGATVAFTAGLTFDVAALVAHGTAVAAGDADTRKTRLDLLWQEWQAVAKARMLFVKADALEQSQRLLAAQRSRQRARLDDARRAVAAGLMTQDAATPLLTAYEDANRQWNDGERQRDQARHDLDALLGVDPGVQLALVGTPALPRIDAAAVREALAQAPRRRPDLLALQAGYAAEDARYRGALRAQFPSLTVGPTRARDTSDVNTAGISIGLSLPLFNRNRGNVAIEAATRGKLRSDYQQRLDAAAIESDRLLQEQALLQDQLREIDGALPGLARAADAAGQAWAAHDIDSLALTAVEGALLAKRLERVATEQALREQAIGLQALLGSQVDFSNRTNAPHGG